MLRLVGERRGSGGGGGGGAKCRKIFRIAKQAPVTPVVYCDGGCGCGTWFWL